MNTDEVMIIKTVPILKRSLMTKLIDGLFGRFNLQTPLKSSKDIFDRNLYKDSLIVIERDGSWVEHLSGFTPFEKAQKQKDQPQKTTVEFK